MKTKDFHYDLDEDLIAQEPLDNRADSKLLILDRKTNKTEHRSFINIVDYLKKVTAWFLIIQK